MAPFRVADFIEMTVLADPDAAHAGFFPQEIKRSPDGRRSSSSPARAI